MSEYANRLRREAEKVKDESDQFPDPEDVGRILRMIAAYDENNVTERPPEGQKTKAISSIRAYTTKVRAIAQEYPLTKTPADTFNQHFQDMRDIDGLSKATIRQYQNGLRQFLYLYPDAETNPEDIPLFKSGSKSVDPTDMLTRGEIQDARAACECMRDLALFDFLLYTGQRNTATRTVRIRDLDLEKGRFRLNPDADGLKGAEKNGKWRDLLLSEATIRQYLKTEHPDPENPDAYLFSTRPGYSDADATEPLNRRSIARVTKDIGKRAGITKPMNPHALRHNFVTIALRRGVPEATIKHQIGHAPGSQVMESTYAHLKDSDHIRAAREAFGKETEETPDESIPETCFKCGSDVPEGASICGVCHTPFTLDGAEKKREADEPEEKDAVDRLRALLTENPGLLDELEGNTPKTETGPASTPAPADD